MPDFDWQKCDDDTEWRSAQQVMPAIAMPHPGGGRRPAWAMRHWRLSAALLLVLTISSGWAWHAAQRGIAQTEIELRDSIEVELWTSTQVAEDETEAELRAEMAAGEVVIGTKIRDLGEDWALVDVQLLPTRNGPVYRQTRVYDYRNGSWVRATVAAEHWGRVQQLESRYFIFHFRQDDAQVVAAVTPQVDALYVELERNFGLTPSPNKLVIEVTVERVTGAIVTPQWTREPLVVPSPALYFAPAELSNSAILAQSIALPLIDHMVERVVEQHAIPSDWRPLMTSMQLWQLWDVEMPLAQWRDDIVTWLYTEVPMEGPQRHSSLPGSYLELCAIHRLWMLSPMLLGIPLECRPSDEGGWIAIRGLAHGPAQRLDELRTPLNEYYEYYDEENYLFRSTQVVAEATLIEYAVATYGYERLPALLAGLAQYDEWETLLPAIYGVSAAEFEAGWQAYLTARYR